MPRTQRPLKVPASVEDVHGAVMAVTCWAEELVCMWTCWGWHFEPFQTCPSSSEAASTFKMSGSHLFKKPFNKSEEISGCSLNLMTTALFFPDFHEKHHIFSPLCCLFILFPPKEPLPLRGDLSISAQTLKVDGYLTWFIFPQTTRDGHQIAKGKAFHIFESHLISGFEFPLEDYKSIALKFVTTQMIPSRGTAMSSCAKVDFWNTKQQESKDNAEKHELGISERGGVTKKFESKGTKTVSSMNFSNAAKSAAQPSPPGHETRGSAAASH